MSNTGDLRVSPRGQMSLPATARRRWGLQDGGDIAYLDLGDAVVLVAGRVENLRRELLESVTDDDWELARTGFGDPDLATE
ncbi:MAG: AbrB/MazE/SpoVT family DNA-binding domain-containing protein [Acidimicrobiaceae bacterium]|nr:AbrB/MazE/SpoVT family DNA-binding domain-containing protein [Acidimicrobiaceae bacterium]